MKVLAENVISTIVVTGLTGQDLQTASADNLQTSLAEQLQVIGEDASLVDANYPASNLLDRHPLKECRISSPSAKFVVTVNGASNGLLIGYTSANSMAYWVYDTAGDLLVSGITSLSGITTYEALITDTTNPLKCTGVTYPYQEAAHTIVFSLYTNNPSVDVYLGIVQAGVIQQSQYDTSKGLVEGLVDYSIGKQLANGSFYYKKRNIVRFFEGSIVVVRDAEFYTFMQNIAQTYGKQSMFWEITDINTDRWLVYGRLDAMPSGTHDGYKYSTVKYKIIEAL